MSKTLILMQGIPGSGKSTVAQSLGGKIYSTDDYWYLQDDSGEYKFNPEKLYAAHVWNQARAKSAMRRGDEKIVIDNTNIKRDHVLPYLAAAAENGYDVQVVRVTVDPALAVQRNTHNVPAETIFRMHAEMEDLI